MQPWLQEKTANQAARQAVSVDLSRKQGQQSFFAAKLPSEKADLKVAMMFYETGTPFNIARQAAWDEMWDAAREAWLVDRSWKPPGYNALRTKLLDKAEELMVEEKKILDQDKKTFGVLLTSDGWSDVNR